MKNYFSGLIAISLALSLTGFSMLPKKLSTEIVVYTGDPYNITEVENPANWEVMFAPSCFGIDKACEIIIDDFYIDWGSWTLSNNVRIDANGSASWGYVPYNVVDLFTNNSIPVTIYNKN